MIQMLSDLKGNSALPLDFCEKQELAKLRKEYQMMIKKESHMNLSDSEDSSDVSPQAFNLLNADIN